MTKPNYPPLQMTRDAACAYLSVGIVTFKKKYEPDLTSVKIGKNYMYLRSDIEALVAEQFACAGVSPITDAPIAKKMIKPRAVTGMDEFNKAARAAQGK